MSKEEPASYIIIKPTTAAYADSMERLTSIVYNMDARAEEECLDARHFRHHVDVFPEGQFIAVDTRTDEVVGLTVSMLVDFDPLVPHHGSWWDAIGQGWLTPHTPTGEWMYGVESCVHPAYQGCGIGSKLMNARFDVLRRLNLRGMIAGSAIIDYPAVASEVSVEQYIQDVAAGRRFDTNLTKQLHKGFRAAALLPGYLSVEETGGWGVLIVWDNKDYQPTLHRQPIRETQPIAIPV